MTEKPKDSLSPTSLFDLDQRDEFKTPFNSAYQLWLDGDPQPLADFIRMNGITSDWEARKVAAIVKHGNKLKLRENTANKKIRELRLYASIKRAYEENGYPLSWDEIYRRIAKKIHPDGDTLQIEALTGALKKLKERYKIK